jgi:hypothetical protein
MAVIPDANEFDREDLRLSPQTHQALANMAAERGEEYDPHEYEERIAASRKSWDDVFDDVKPVEGNEDRFEEWLAMGESADR